MNNLMLQSRQEQRRSRERCEPGEARAAPTSCQFLVGEKLRPGTETGRLYRSALP